jgi:hypothetical protein
VRRDYDNDGFDDLFATYWGQNVLYHNNSDGTFTEVTAKAGLVQQGQRPRLNTACCFLDYDKDGTSTSLWPITSTWTFRNPGHGLRPILPVKRDSSDVRPEGLEEVKRQELRIGTKFPSGSTG